MSETQMMIQKFPRFCIAATILIVVLGVMAFH